MKTSHDPQQTPRRAQFIVLIQGNARSEIAPREWLNFFSAAQRSGLFQGGSAIANRIVVGDAALAKSTDHIVGYMRFDSDHQQPILDLLKKHPVVVHGGSVELCEMPELN
jgi:hypothetical protein